MKESLLLVLPYPDSRLLPNRKGHWATKAEATRLSRGASCVMAAKQVREMWPDDPAKYTYYAQNIDACHMTITWYPKQHRYPDFDSLLRATKPIIDGLVDAHVLADDSHKVIRRMVLSRGKPDKKNPRTEVLIEGL